MSKQWRSRVNRASAFKTDYSACPQIRNKTYVVTEHVSTCRGILHIYTLFSATFPRSATGCPKLRFLSLDCCVSVTDQAIWYLLQHNPNIQVNITVRDVTRLIRKMMNYKDFVFWFFSPLEITTMPLWQSIVKSLLELVIKSVLGLFFISQTSDTVWLTDKLVASPFLIKVPLPHPYWQTSVSSTKLGWSFQL